MKNTLLKLIAVFALCFVIGSVLVACGGGDSASDAPYIGGNGNWFVDGVDSGVPATGPQGPAGAPGQNGQDGQDGKDGQDATAVECAHEWQMVEVIEHTKENNGKYINVCNLCNSAELVVDIIHTWTDVPVEATCTEGKYVGETCTVCGEKGEGEFVSEPNGHKFINSIPVTEAGKTICEDGGILAGHCTVCLEQVYEVVEATGHTVTADRWDYDTVVNAGVSHTGTLLGACINCPKEDVEYELPALLNEKLENNEAYTVVVEAATCSEQGKATYTFVDADANVEYTFEITIEAKNHQLNGQDYTNFEITEGSNILPYWYGVADADGRLPALGIQAFANSPFKCGVDGQTGYFVCEACDKVISVGVDYAHNGKVLSNETASCTAGVAQYVVCDNKDCNTDLYDETTKCAVQTLKVAPHSYEYKVNGDKIDITCANCDYTSVLNTGSDVAHLDLDAASCLKAGTRKYVYLTSNSKGEYFLNEKIVAVGVTAHTINGVLASDVCNEDGSFDSDVAGLQEFANDPFSKVACGETGVGYYICDVCKAAGQSGVINVTVVKVHTVPAEHVVVDSTCVVPGTDTYTCPDCNEDVVELLDLAAHKTVVSVKNENELHIACTVCEKENADLGEGYEEYPVVADEVKLVDSKNKTCTEEGFEKYELIFEGKPSQFVTINLGLADHKLGGKEIANGTILDVNVEGLNLFANQPITECGAPVNAWYNCEVCGDVCSVQAERKHAPDFSEIEDTRDCVTGQDNVPCVHCDELITLEALGHDYKYTAGEVNLENGKVTITKTCVVCHDDEAEENLEGSKVEVIVTLPELPDYTKEDESEIYDWTVSDATCEINGFVKWVCHYEIDGKVIDIAFKTPILAEGHDEFSDKCLVFTFDVEETDTWYTVYVCPTCGDYVLIDSGLISEREAAEELPEETPVVPEEEELV